MFFFDTESDDDNMLTRGVDVYSDSDISICGPAVAFSNISADDELDDSNDNPEPNPNTIFPSSDSDVGAAAGDVYSDSDELPLATDIYPSDVSNEGEQKIYKLDSDKITIKNLSDVTSFEDPSKFGPFNREFFAVLPRSWINLKGKKSENFPGSVS